MKPTAAANTASAQPPEPKPRPAPVSQHPLATIAREWFSTEGERFIFVAKTMLAAFGALWIAFRLGLDSPGTSITTVFILALPSSGMVLEKAFYRLLGTVVGCIASVTLIALFPQQPAPLFIGIAIWIGLCTSGAAMFRNAQSYSFVLAGYTSCIILVPALDHPTQVFLSAVARVTEVGLGIICSAVVNDALFPRHQNLQVMRTVQARYVRFVDFCHDALENRIDPAAVELAHLQFAADIAALESGRAAAFFEAAHARGDTRQVHAFNAAFMATLTTFYTMHRLLHRLRQDPQGSGTVLALVEPLYMALAGAIRADSSGAQLDSMRAGLQAKVAEARQQLVASNAERPQHVDFETAVELLDRFACNMRDFQLIYHGLTQKKRQQVSEPLAYTPKTPPAIVIAAGVRAATALLVLASAWYYMAWPAATNALLMGTIFCGLASSAPRPTAMVKQVLNGFLIALPVSFAIEYFILPKADGYAMMVMAMLPVMGLGAYLTSGRKTAGMGVGVCLFAAQMVTPSNPMLLDGASFLNNAIAMLLGVVLANVIFNVVLPTHTMGQKTHVRDALWREALHACTGSLFRLKHRFGNRVRDLLSQLNAAAGPAPDEATRAVVRQGLTLLELGQSVIDMRMLIEQSPPGPARAALQQCVQRIAAYLREPAQESCRAAVDAIFQAGPHVRQAQLTADPQRTARLQKALTDLHSIYTSLLDQLPQAPGGTQSAA
jgi:uncharacterized membrane protein YccC